MAIPGRWFRLLLSIMAVFGASAATAPKPSTPAELAGLVRAYRELPTPARRAAVEAYAAAHARELSGSLARLALGVVAYEQKDYATATENLKSLAARLPRISDYVAFYLGAARVEANDLSGVAQDLAPAHRSEIPSPFYARAWLLEARALKETDPSEAIRLLREHYAELPQPEADLNLADSYQAAHELAHAADFYQRVYYRYVSGDAASRAAAALIALKDAMGPDYPPPLPQQMLQRANRLLDAREYSQAKKEFQDLLSQLTGVDRDLARVRIGATDYLSGNAAAAFAYLVGLDVPESEADAERLYYIEECARRLPNDDEMLAAVKRLDKMYRRSPWRLRALVSAANRFLLANRPEDYLPLYKAVYEDFPAESQAALAHWKVTFQAYLANSADSAGLLREHLQKYPGHATAGAALYFLARTAEFGGDLGTAAAIYRRLNSAFPNTYYAVLARNQLDRADLQSAGKSDKADDFLRTLVLPEAKPVPQTPTPATTARVDRSRLLRTTGLNDLADAELRFGARTDGQPVLLAMEMAGSADAPYQGLRDMKSLSGDYLNLPLEAASRKFWELLFPLPYREYLVPNARSNNLDPYLVAGLIRQESEFNPQAVSRANAFGLTQVRPGTGRQFARRLGLTRFTNGVLFQPATNLKIGTAILRSMLDQHGGNLEQTLASYNAGPNRATEWIGWKTYREPAEFVESIPFTETRDYVQAVLRNADIYRRLYR